MESKELSIVIVTFKSEGKIFDCLNSIPNNIEVKIVENSNNKTFQKNIQNKYQNVECILMGKNTIENFFTLAKKKEEFWLIGPANNQSTFKNFESNNIIEVNNLKGFAIFLNMKKFDQNFFDENFFLYFEEIDLCKFVKKKW